RMSLLGCFITGDLPRANAGLFQTASATAGAVFRWIGAGQKMPRRLRRASSCRLPSAVKAEGYGLAKAAIRVLPVELESKHLRRKNDLFGNDVGSAVALRNARREYVFEHNGIICERGRSVLLREVDRQSWNYSITRQHKS